MRQHKWQTLTKTQDKTWDSTRHDTDRHHTCNQTSLTNSSSVASSRQQNRESCCSQPQKQDCRNNEGKDKTNAERICSKRTRQWGFISLTGWNVSGKVQMPRLNFKTTSGWMRSFINISHLRTTKVETNIGVSKAILELIFLQNSFPVERKIIPTWKVFKKNFSHEKGLQD